MDKESRYLSRREALAGLSALAGVTTFGLANAQAQGVTLRPRTTGFVNVRDFGARGDGNTDDTSAFERAIAAAKQQGLAVFAPRGLYRTTRTLVVENISITGPTPGVWCADTDVLPTLLPTHRDTPGVHLKAGGGLEALTIRYDWEREPESGPPAVLVGGVGAYVGYVKILYCWDGILADGVSNIGRLNIENVFIVAPRNIGVRVTGTWDAPTIRNVEVWNLGPVPRPLEKGIGFDLGKNDLLRMSDCFAFAMNIGYLLRDTIPGSTIAGGTWGMLTGCSTDYCSIGIDVRGENTVSVTGGTYWNHHQSVRVNGEKARVRVTGAELKSNAGPCVEVFESEQVVVDGCSLVRAMEEYDFPVVHLHGGYTTLTGNHLRSNTEGVRIGARVRSVLLAGNTLQAQRNRAVVNQAPANAPVALWGNLMV